VDVTGIAEQYHVADFTRARYRELLRTAARSYTFRGYTDFSRDERFVLWRHDVDFSVHSARALARIEAEEGCRATYFLHPHSEYYNLLEREVTELVREIAGLGHDLGIHFDSHYHGITEESALDEALTRERALLEDVFGREVRVFSFHNTTPFTMACQQWSYAGLINTYAAYFQREVGYVSDSNGYWRFRRLADVLEEAREPRLQVLTHDAWWQEEAMPPRARVFRSVLGRARKVLGMYDAGFAPGGARVNVCDAAPLFAPLAEVLPDDAAFLSDTWLGGRPETVFRELWRIHLREARRLSAREGTAAEGADALVQPFLADGEAGAWARWRDVEASLAAGGEGHGAEVYREGVRFLAELAARLARAAGGVEAGAR
jgi:hypothetical protein